MSDQRTLYESAVVERLKESGFLEIEIRTECLVRCEDGYQDEVINAGWHYWNAAIAANPTTTSIVAPDKEVVIGTIVGVDFSGKKTRITFECDRAGTWKYEMAALLLFRGCRAAPSEGSDANS